MKLLGCSHYSTVIFLLAYKSPACVISEEYLDTGRLKEVMVSITRNLQSKRFTVNDFIHS